MIRKRLQNGAIAFINLVLMGDEKVHEGAKGAKKGARKSGVIEFRVPSDARSPTTLRHAGVNHNRTHDDDVARSEPQGPLGSVLLLLLLLLQQGFVVVCKVSFGQLR